MLNGEKVRALRTARGWSFEETAAQVRSKGAPHVRYQHIQQLEQYPARVPRYLLQLAAAFDMTVEEFDTWSGGPEPSRSRPQDNSVREHAAAYAATPDLAAEVREISLALIVLVDWIRETRPAEAPLLLRSLESAAKRLGSRDGSHLHLLIQSVSGPAAQHHAAKKASR